MKKMRNYFNEKIDLRFGDCLEIMKSMKNDSVDFTLTDIPYDAVNRPSNGLRELNKGQADILTFDLTAFLEEVYRITKNSICIFCGKEQFSNIYKYFASKKGTVRPIVWQKSNPSPMNGQYIYLSGVELGVWFKKAGAKVFNAHCKNTVFKYPNGSSKLHPTEKNHGLLKELILDNTNENDIVFDCCMGSGSHLVVALENNRRALGIELDENYFNIAKERIYNA
jgi:DNA modification methylase